MNVYALLSELGQACFITSTLVFIIAKDSNLYSIA